MPFLSSLLASMLARLASMVAGKSVAIAEDAAMLAVAAGCSFALWQGTSTTDKVLAAVLAADAVAMYLKATGRFPFLSGFIAPKK